MESLELMETVEVPWDQLSPGALRGLVEEFVTRDGTDYGEQEMGLERRCQQVYTFLKQRQALILFSPESGQCNIVTRDRLNI